MKLKVLWIAGLMLAGMASPQVHAAFVRTGSGSGNTNANAAYALWKTDVSNVFVQDNFNGLSGTPLTTSLGNKFVGFNGGTVLSNSGSGGGVTEGTRLRLNKGSLVVGFNWSIVSPSYAFGMFGFDNDGGTISISFIDGTNQNYTAPTGPGSSDSMFWGISGLTSAVASVTITTTDPGGISFWDNFVYGGTAPVPVPEPTSIAMWGLGALGMMFARRKRQQMKLAA